ncbi:hypothetical protein LARV_02926 [Longilinea arvoryzae]|uniref:Uncharacterized protein n=1 Tax=Longilinea arvoryzae TaxID=360412 RepID=A0A0S7BHS7_9CHLR|nr:hypothetical protein [Longilinea arvoryzae]GAP15145.1 hypothetical protein LARV_02926 [Longilinea arvoryzae]
MRDLFPVLETYEIWIYALLGLALLFYLRRLALAAREWRSAQFGFERIVAQRKISFALTLVVIFGLLMLAEFILVSFVAPAMPNQRILATPTLDLISTPTATLPVSGVGVTPTSESVQATPLAVTAEGCVPGSIEWIYPQNGDEIQGTVNLVFLVNVTNLGFYKYEYVQAGSTEWVTIAADDVPVASTPEPDAEPQHAWNTESLIPGDYQLRLVVTDNANNTFPACTIAIRIIGN